MSMTAPELAKAIRRKISDLNDYLLLAALQEVKVELDIEPMPDTENGVQLGAWIGQEL